MIDMTRELKHELLSAKSAEDAAKLVEESGLEISVENIALLWEEIGRARQQCVREFSRDELEAVSGGKFDPPSGCTLVFTA